MTMGPEVREPSHEELEELLGAYALHAVPEEERRLVEAHLAVCPQCRAEVEDHRRTAAMLASAGAPAPEGLWDRIGGALERAAPVDLKAARAARMPGRAGRWAAMVAAAAAVVAIAVLGLKVVEQDRILDRLVASSEERGLIQAANAALLDPRAGRITLTSEDRSVMVEAVLLPDGTGYLVRNNLGPLPTDRTYQLWALDDGDPISVGVLGREPAVVAFSVDPRVTGLAITEERSGGVVSTENEPLVVGQVQTS